jgi:hypothetical protein
MKLLLASQIATACVFLVTSPATVSAQTATSESKYEFTLKKGGTFTCDVAGSKCQVMVGFDADDVTSVGGRINNVLGGPTQWIALDAANDVLTVGVCSGDDCTVECNYGCTCTEPDATECPFTDSGAGSWQSSTGLALVTATLVSTLLAVL